MKKIFSFKTFRALIAIVLTLSIAVSANIVSLTVSAQQGKNTYVSDVQIFQAATEEEAVKLCEGAGYIPYKENLNQGAIEKVRFGFNREAPYVMLGYRTTDNRNLAVTDIQMLTMGTGYQLRDYQTYAAALLSSNQGAAEGMAAAASDLANNYNQGSPAAAIAVRLLDIFYVEDLERKSSSGFLDFKYDNSSDFKVLYDLKDKVSKFLFGEDDSESERIPLGQYILSGKADTEFFSKLLSFSSLTIVSAVNSALCTGTSEYNNYYNKETGNYETKVWAERLSSSNIKKLQNEGMTSDELKNTDLMYMDNARALAPALQSFATYYENAVSSSDSDNLDFSDGEDKKTDEELLQSTQDIDENSLDPIYLGAYKQLDKYTYDNESLAQWIIELGRRTYSSAEDYRVLYPLCDVLTSAQMNSIKYSGFVTFVNTMTYNNETQRLAEEQLLKIEDLLRKHNTVKSGEYRVSIWLGVDRNLYDGKIAMTDDAIRNGAANKVTKRPSSEVFDENVMLLNKIVTMATGSVTAIFLLTSIAISIKSHMMVSAGIKAGIAAAVGFWAGFAKFSSILGTITSLAWYIEIGIIIITAIVVAVKNELHVPSSDYTEMPGLIYESKMVGGENTLVKYSAVTEPYRGRLADLNAYEGNKWNLMFISHDANAGSPVMAGSDGSIFKLQVNNTLTPLTYKPMTVFGQTTAGDMNANAYKLKDDTHTYLFYHTEKSLSDKVNEGETTKDEGLYIADLFVSSAANEDAAKAAITKKDGKYYVFDQNVGTAKAPAYIGYSLTADKKKAITDLRMATAENEKTISFGEANYSYAGSLPNGDGLYYTTNTLSGTPIRSQMMRVDSYDKAPKGWEAIVYFSGAPVYHFNDTFAIYFEPETKYTSGDWYVAGMYFMSGDYTDKEKIEKENLDLMKVKNRQIGGIVEKEYPSSIEDNKKLIPGSYYTNNSQFNDCVNLLENIQWEEREYIDTREYNSYYHRYMTYVGYSLTHNPFRAIRDIATYRSTVKNDLRLNAVINKSIYIKDGKAEKNVSAGYAAAEEMLSKSISKDMNRKNHSFRSKETTDEFKQVLFEAPNDGTDYSWDYSHVIMQGLYTLGPVTGMNPLKASDVVVSGERFDGRLEDSEISTVMNQYARTLDGELCGSALFHSIQDLKHIYNTTAQNISLTDAYSYGLKKVYDESFPLYIYLRGSVHKPLYIASVAVGSYSEAIIKREDSKVSKDTLKQIGKTSEDIAWNGAMNLSSGEIITENIAQKKSESYNGKANDNIASEKYPVSCAYVGVTRTDDINKAAKGLVMVKKSALDLKKNTPPGKISLISENTEFMIPQGSSIIDGADGEYYLYYTNNSGALPGSPLTEITVNDMPLVKGASTALCADKIGAVQPYGDPNLTNYIHCAYKDVGGTYINKLYIGEGKNLKGAMCNLLEQGCSEGCVVDINLGAGDKAIMLGYRTFSITDNQFALHKRSVGTSKDPLREALRDVIITTDKPYQSEMVYDGVVYRAVSEKNLNSGTTGDDMFMYYCTDYFTEYYNSKHSEDEKLAYPSLYEKFSPVTKIVMAVGDRVPYNTSLDEQSSDDAVLRWENLLSSDKKKTDLNLGVLKTDKSGKHMVENRLYMYIHRYNNAVKPGAEITGGFLTDTETAGTLYLTN